MSTKLTAIANTKAKGCPNETAFDVLEESRNSWMSTDLKARKSLTERKMRLRKSKIVCTIGPSSCSREALFELCDRGMNVSRLNMSHGDHESHKQVIDLVKEYNASGPVQIRLLFSWTPRDPKCDRATWPPR